MPLASSRRIGIFGGAFDPIHVGHLILAEEAHFQLGLECVYFVPTGDPPHKQERTVTPVAHRLCMVELATATTDHFYVSRVDADRTGPHYTVDMMQLLQAQFGENATLYFLMGMDSLRDLPTWRNPQWLVDHCRLVAFSRPDVEVDWATLETTLPGLRARVILLGMPLVEISSTTLRARVRTGATVRHQTPESVDTYIRKHRLYVT
ncbi:MAG: nicotinate-nucleotide adenylyltransferase [Caldilineaceae bacterium]|nr:nicotinate-nucleotide adenylyltransferase [Caldilineaceae bacterium]